MNRKEIITAVKARVIYSMLNDFASQIADEIYDASVEDPKRFIGGYDELGRLANFREFEEIIARYVDRNRNFKKLNGKETETLIRDIHDLCEFELRNFLADTNRSCHYDDVVEASVRTYTLMLGKLFDPAFRHLTAKVNKIHMLKE